MGAISNVVTDRQRLEAAPAIDQFVLDLSRAHTPQSIGDAIGSYCGSAFHSPAGMIFIRRGAEVQLVSQWPSTLGSDQRLVKRISEKGPVARALTSGRLVLWHRQRAPYSRIGLYFYRVLRQFHGRHITFLPLAVPGDGVMGVIAIVLPHEKFSPALYDELARFGRVVSGCFFRALAYHEAIGARERAENALKSKDEFLSILSHELKNPMMPILGWAVALSSRTLPADKQDVAIDGIIRSVRALNYLIEDLFDSMRISAGKFHLEFAETRIQEVARDALTAIQYTVERKKLRVSTEISEAIPPFMADRRRLQQVLMNLLNNAVKFTPEGGSIALQIRRRDHTVECIVSDKGKGIERSFLPFVFERFRQGKRASRIHAAGLGLGLAIVREIVELHGGSIDVLSRGIGKGSTFTVRLPMRRKNGRNGTRQLKSA